MKCLNCGSEELKYDELSDMYFCPKCNRLYDKGEIVEDMNEDDIEDDFEDGIKEWKEEEDLNGFSLTVLSIMQSIPIIGLMVPILVNNSNVKVTYKKQFAYRFIGQVVICIVLIIFGAVLYINDKTYVVDNLQHNMNLIVQSVRGSYISKDDIQIPNLTTVPKDSMIDTDDYGEYKDSGISDMSNSKYIFYINPKKSYTFNTIKNDSDEVIGFMFTEVVEEVKTNGNKKRK